MANTSVGFGVVLILLGVGGYVATGAQSPTALIPAGVGLLLVVFGVLARNPKLRMHAMHGAALVALIGLAGSVGGVGPLVKMLGGATVARPSAAIARTAMAALCLAFIAIAVRSFIVARRARRKPTTPPAPAP
jgi:hypothetical protein